MDNFNYNISISGQVVGSDGKALADVSVFSKFINTNGTTSDSNGYFSLIVGNLDTVVFSYATYSKEFLALSIPKKVVLNFDLPEVNLGNLKKPKYVIVAIIAILFYKFLI